MFKWLLAVFPALLLLEIYLLLTVGGWIGALPTVALLVLTAVAGIALIRIQGLNALFRLQEKLRRGEPPAEEVMTGAALLVAGVLLLIPGFFTDALGFLLLMPVFRRILLGRLVRPSFRPVGPVRRGQAGRNTLEGEFRRED